MSNWGNIEIPEKVFIEREGAYYEYSETAPHHYLNQGSVLDGLYGTSNMIELFTCLPEVYSAVDKVASGVSDAMWELRMFKDDKVMYDDKDFNRLFSNPNPFEDIRKLIYNAVCYEILTGRQIFYFNRPKTLEATYNNILTWTNLPPGAIIKSKNGVDPYSATSIMDFIQSVAVGKRDIPIENIMPVLHTSLNNNYDVNCCHSMLLGAKKAIDNLIPVYEARKAIYVKRGAMGMWVSRKGDASGSVALSPSEKKNVRDEVDNSYGLTGGRATIGVSDQPIDFVQSAMSLAEMLPFEETLSNAVAIHAVLGIPRSMVPSKDYSTFNNVNDDKKTFISQVIQPWANRYANMFTEYFGLKENRRYIYPNFSHLPALQENLKEKAGVDMIYGNVWLQRFNSGISTLNDWITAIDGVKSLLPLYDKKIFEMDAMELDQAKAVLTLKAPTVQPQNTDNGNTNLTQDKGTSGGN